MNLFEEVDTGLDGLGQLRALIRSGRKPGIARSLDFEYSPLAAPDVRVSSPSSALAGWRRSDPTQSRRTGWESSMVLSRCSRRFSNLARRLILSQPFFHVGNQFFHQVRRRRRLQQCPAVLVAFN